VSKKKIFLYLELILPFASLHHLCIISTSIKAIHILCCLFPPNSYVDVSFSFCLGMPRFSYLTSCFGNLSSSSLQCHPLSHCPILTLHLLVPMAPCVFYIYTTVLCLPSHSSSYCCHFSDLNTC
jgi:hypothetical protein